MIPNVRSEAPLSTRDLLLIGGTESSRQEIQSRLETIPGLRLCAATASGRDGLHLFLWHQPRFVILDVEVADADPFDLLRELRQVRDDCLVFLLGASHDPFVIEVSRRLGATAYLHRVDEIEDLTTLFHTIARSCDRPEARRHPCLRARGLPFPGLARPQCQSVGPHARPPQP